MKSKVKRKMNNEQKLEILNFWEKYTKDIDYSFFDVFNSIYFGEMTLFHFSGIVPFEPEEWDYKLGSWIKLI